MPTVTSSSALTLTELFGEYVIRKGGRFLQYVGTNLRRERWRFQQKGWRLPRTDGGCISIFRIQKMPTATSSTDMLGKKKHTKNRQ
jgi:hypothetical protein